MLKNSGSMRVTFLGPATNRLTNDHMWFMTWLQCRGSGSFAVFIRISLVYVYPASTCSQVHDLLVQ